MLDAQEALTLYHGLLETPSWTLCRTSTGQGAAGQFGSFPGMTVEHQGNVLESFYSGYFRSLLFRVRRMARKEAGLELPGEILRIHLGAKKADSITKSHTDLRSPTAWTVLGFLNPVWNPADGGELMIEDQKIECKMGRFVLFRSNLEHNGGFVKNPELNHWRISLNMILDEPKS